MRLFWYIRVKRISWLNKVQRKELGGDVIRSLNVEVWPFSLFWHTIVMFSSSSSYMLHELFPVSKQAPSRSYFLPSVLEGLAIQSVSTTIESIHCPTLCTMTISLTSTFFVILFLFYRSLELTHYLSHCIISKPPYINSTSRCISLYHLSHHKGD